MKNHHNFKRAQNTHPKLRSRDSNDLLTECQLFKQFQGNKMEKSLKLYLKLSVTLFPVIIVLEDDRFPNRIEYRKE
jgi:hypothetical protein